MDFDFQTLAIALAGVSLGLIGVVMAGSAFFPQIAEQYKNQITNVIVGVILVGVASVSDAALGG